ncbi:uncharacterized protein Dwil_GK20941 [Drosophila willistoni]|uniref:Uncharacterized protein n=1 Tax=Drosophila willistoni TaxID=7260 RepID=B4MK49_DROWI|nr:uncharacterized protein LOC6638486 [Drosophila willistoni]EDW72488.1 uncharacterized protein Dwil_GK20941 [Drosophila willistoni]
MFELETEDMLPRAAPRPCAGMPTGMDMAANEQTVKPIVPEVSLIFGPNAPSGVPPTSMQSQTNADPKTQPAPPPPSFASWKKQMLPRVNFSPVLSTELGPRPSHTHNHNTNLTSSSPGSTVSNEYIIIPRERIYTTTTASAVTTPPASANNPICYMEKRRDIDYLPSPRSVSDVLTICATTQTDNVNRSPPANSPLTPGRGACSLDISNLVQKQDLAALVSLLEAMREDQRQLKQLCESMAKQQQARTAPSTRTSTGCQCEIITINQNNNVKRHTPIIQDYIIEEEEPPPPPCNPKVVRTQPNQYQSPRPMAQSTGYRANTPNGKIMPMPMHMTKPNTEKSLVMNELALKYLRQPVDELMRELHVSGDLPATSSNAPRSPMAEPLRQIDNITAAQSPNNMSNASYKYLKKYRLLPEDEMSPGSPQQQAEPMLDLENIRNQPKLL